MSRHKYPPVAAGDMLAIVEELFELGSLFGGVATDPISAVLLAIGAIITVGTVAVMAYLAFGALVDVLIPESLGQTPRRDG